MDQKLFDKQFIEGIVIMRSTQHGLGMGRCLRIHNRLCMDRGESESLDSFELDLAETGKG
jgi:hypothetical protein